MWIAMYCTQLLVNGYASKCFLGMIIMIIISPTLSFMTVATKLLVPATIHTHLLEPDWVWESLLHLYFALYFYARSLNMSNLQNKNSEKITQFQQCFKFFRFFFFFQKEGICNKVLFHFQKNVWPFGDFMQNKKKARTSCTLLVHFVFFSCI
jgi:hypothetical protein